MYEMLLPIIQPRVELSYPNFEWKSIWTNISIRYIDINNRSIIFKYIHEILPNKKKLNIWYKTDPNCTSCNVEENNIHMVLYCCRVQKCKEILIKLVFYLCDVNIDQYLLKCLFFDFPKISKKVNNTLSIIISEYIATIWFNRESPDNLDYKFKARIKNLQFTHMNMLNNKGKSLLTPNYCDMNRNIVDRL